MAALIVVAMLASAMLGLYLATAAVESAPPSVFNASDDWSAKLDIKAKVGTSFINGNPIRRFGVAPACTALYDGSPCDEGRVIAAPVLDDFLAYFHYPSNPADTIGIFDTTQLSESRIPFSADLKWPLRLDVKTLSGTQTVEFSITATEISDIPGASLSPPRRVILETSTGTLVGDFRANSVVTFTRTGVSQGYTEDFNVRIFTVPPATAVIAAPAASPPPTANEGASVAFISVGSAPGSAATGTTLTFAWDFGDSTGTSTDANPTYTYPDGSGTGSFTVTLTVTDDAGGSGTASVPIKVANVDPTITNVTADPNPVGEGTPTTVTINATDPAGTNDPLQFSFDCDGLSGTGTGGFEVGPQPGNTTICTFPDDSVHTVNVSMDDGDGGVTPGSVNVTVNNLPPFGGTVIASPSPVNEGGTVSIIASGWVDPAGANDPLKYSFDCDGNGVFTDPRDFADKTTSSHPCTFLDDSDHIVNVRVDDGEVGGATSASVTVTVNNVPPQVSVTADPSILPKSGDSTITATATDVAADVAAGFTYSFDCNGNGVFTDPGDKGPQSTNSATCFFRVPEDQGTKTVNVRVVDKDAGAGNGSVIVNVGSPDAPKLIFPINDTPILLRPVFQWKGDDLSDFYDIEVAKGGFGTGTPRTAGLSDIPHSGAVGAIQSKQIPLPDLDAGSRNEWRVRAKTTTGADPLAGEYSTASFITVGAQMTLVLQVTLQGTGTPAVPPKFDAFRDPSEPRWAILIPS